MSTAQIKTYHVVQTSTADPARIVLLLLDGAAQFLTQAVRRLERGDRAAFAQLQSKAHAIIGELANCLDHEVGGEVAANLARLYAFMLRHLTEGLLEESSAHVQRVLALLQPIREAFEVAVEQTSRERT